MSAVPAGPVAAINASLEVLLRLSSSRKVIEIQSEAARRRLSQPALVVLRRLLEDGAMPIGELARRAQMDGGAAARLISALESDGLALRTTSATDGRSVVVSLTADGEGLVRHVMALRQQHMLDTLADWSESDLAGFAELLARFVSSLRATSFPQLAPSPTAAD